MPSIPIRNCHRCKPEEWRQVSPSSAIYWCLVCKKQVKQILEKRKRSSAQELKDRLEEGDREIEGYSKIKDSPQKEDYHV